MVDPILRIFGGCAPSQVGGIHAPQVPIATRMQSLSARCRRPIHQRAYVSMRAQCPSGNFDFGIAGGVFSKGPENAPSLLRIQYRLAKLDCWLSSTIRGPMSVPAPVMRLTQSLRVYLLFATINIATLHVPALAGIR